MVDERELVGLLNRADWKQLSLVADFSGELDLGLMYSWCGLRPPWVPADEGPTGIQLDTGRLLVAPGGRFRFDEADPPVAGPHLWPLSPRVLLRPADLLGCALSPRGRVVVAGRDGYHVVATPGPWRKGRPKALDRIEAVVDAQTGFLLRREEIFEGQRLRLAEFTSVSFGETVEDADFDSRSAGAGPGAGPGEAEAEDPFDEMGFDPFGGAGWRAAKAAANAAGNMLGTAVRRSPRGEHEPGAAEGDEPSADADAQMPADEAFSYEGGGVLDDDLVYAIHRGGESFSGEFHQWTDMKALTGELRASADGHRWGGVGAFLGAVSDRIGTMHRVWRVRTGSGGRYRIEYLLGPQQDIMGSAVASDGEQRWREYENRITIGPGGPADSEIAMMIDASWLLQCELSGVTEVTFGGRRAFAMRVEKGERPYHGIMTPTPSDMVAVVDAELGILLLVVSRWDGKPATRSEFRDIVSAASAATSATSATGEDWDDAFRLDIPPGIRVIRHDGGMLNEIDMPEPVRAAARAAGSGIAAAKGFLDSLRGPRRPA